MESKNTRTQHKPAVTSRAAAVHCTKPSSRPGEVFVGYFGPNAAIYAVPCSATTKTTAEISGSATNVTRHNAASATEDAISVSPCTKTQQKQDNPPFDIEDTAYDSPSAKTEHNQDDTDSQATESADTSSVLTESLDGEIVIGYRLPESEDNQASPNKGEPALKGFEAADDWDDWDEVPVAKMKKSEPKSTGKRWNPTTSHSLNNFRAEIQAEISGKPPVLGGKSPNLNINKQSTATKDKQDIKANNLQTKSPAPVAQPQKNNRLITSTTRRKNIMPKTMAEAVTVVNEMPKGTKGLGASRWS
jgi:hypothetical protein